MAGWDFRFEQAFALDGDVDPTRVIEGNEVDTGPVIFSHRFRLDQIGPDRPCREKDAALEGAVLSGKKLTTNALPRLCSLSPCHPVAIT